MKWLFSQEYFSLLYKLNVFYLLILILPYLQIIFLLLSSLVQGSISGHIQILKGEMLVTDHL